MKYLARLLHLTAIPLILLVTSSLLVGCSSSLPPVPKEYQPLYEELSAELAHFEGVLNQKWNHSRGQTIIATELAFANGNIGEGLLAPTTMDSNRVLLDHLQAMGVKGVVLAIKYPLLSRISPARLNI